MRKNWVFGLREKYRFCLPIFVFHLIKFITLSLKLFSIYFLTLEILHLTSQISKDFTNVYGITSYKSWCSISSFWCLIHWCFQFSHHSDKWADEFTTGSKRELLPDEKWVDEFSKLNVQDWAGEFQHQADGAPGEDTMDSWASAYDE